MRLTDAQQERYSRHLLLDELGGEGQERLLSACVRVRGSSRASRWAARYLAASGVGTLILDDASAAAECRALSPDVLVFGPADVDRLATWTSIPSTIRQAPRSGQPKPARGRRCVRFAS